MTIFFTHVGDISLKILCYTSFNVPKYKNHYELNLPFITLQLALISL
jgi:hypothetical protein